MAAGLALNSIFYVLAAIAVVGVIITLLVPIRRTHDLHFTPIEPSAAVGRGVAQAERINPAG